MLPCGFALNMFKRQKLCIHWFIFRTEGSIDFIHSTPERIYWVNAVYSCSTNLNLFVPEEGQTIHWITKKGRCFVEVVSAAVLGAAGGAELRQAGVSLGDKAVGGFALTLPILGINVFLCRHIVSHFAPDCAITCTHKSVFKPEISPVCCLWNCG